MQLKKAANDGEWFTFKKSDQKSDQGGVEFKLRRLPGPEARSIAFRVSGTTRQWGAKGMRMDLSKNFEVRLAQGAWILLDSRNADWPVTDADAGPLTEALKEQVKPGDVVRLDGRWNEQVKRIVLADATEILDFVHLKDSEFEMQADEQEEEALGN